MTQPLLNLEQIMQVLPHRYPFLLVDRVLEMETGRFMRALKNVTFNEEFFQGHFPGRPVMPGVLIIEAMAQVGGILAYFTDPGLKGKIIYFMAMDKVKFRRPVVPGDQLILEVKDLHRSSRAWKMEGKALVDGKVAAQAEVTAAW
jgi:3-hydroxyacyl-[acyl-carrier-protein] dehydratase